MTLLQPYLDLPPLHPIFFLSLPCSTHTHLLPTLKFRSWGDLWPCAACGGGGASVQIYMTPFATATRPYLTREILQQHHFRRLGILLWFLEQFKARDHNSGKRRTLWILLMMYFICAFKKNNNKSIEEHFKANFSGQIYFSRLVLRSRRLGSNIYKSTGSHKKAIYKEGSLAALDR